MVNPAHLGYDIHSSDFLPGFFGFIHITGSCNALVVKQFFRIILFEITGLNLLLQESVDQVMKFFMADVYSIEPSIHFLDFQYSSRKLIYFFDFFLSKYINMKNIYLFFLYILHICI